MAGPPVTCPRRCVKGPGLARHRRNEAARQPPLACRDLSHGYPRRGLRCSHDGIRTTRSGRMHGIAGRSCDLIRDAWPRVGLARRSRNDRARSPLLASTIVHLPASLLDHAPSAVGTTTAGDSARSSSPRRGVAPLRTGSRAPAAPARTACPGPRRAPSIPCAASLLRRASSCAHAYASFGFRSRRGTARTYDTTAG